MKQIVIEYSGDFGRDVVANETYKRLREDGYHLQTASVNHLVKRGITSATYTLSNGSLLPEKSALEERLKDLNLRKVEVVID